MFKNLFGQRLQAQQEEALSNVENAVENNVEETEGMTSVYHLIVLDESGSMYCVAGQTISGCNETIQTVRMMQNSNKDTQVHYVSIYLFESGRSRYIVHNQPVDAVLDITDKDYRPNACTPLFDALGFTLTELKEIMGQPDTLGYVTIITDGEENSSCRYTLEDVRNLIDELKKKDVIFSFIGANIDAAEYAKRLNIGNSMQWLEYASDQLQLPWWKAGNIDEVIQYLREGKVAVVLMNDQSVFMEGQHFVVFTGITEDGKILVNDPYGPNYTAWHLQEALVSGFERGDLTGGYSGGWVYDPGSVPEWPFIYEPVPNTDVFRYGDLQLSQEDRDLIARLVCMEGESEPFEGQQGIAEVILNRMAADNFPDTAKGIIFAEGQFMAAGQLHLAEPTHTQYEAVERALNGPYVLDADVVFFSKFAVNDNVWGTIGSHIFCHQW